MVEPLAAKLSVRAFLEETTMKFHYPVTKDLVLSYSKERRWSSEREYDKDPPVRQKGPGTMFLVWGGFRVSG